MTGVSELFLSQVHHSSFGTLLRCVGTAGNKGRGIMSAQGIRQCQTGSDFIFQRREETKWGQTD